MRIYFTQATHIPTDHSNPRRDVIVTVNEAQRIREVSILGEVNSHLLLLKSIDISAVPGVMFFIYIYIAFGEMIGRPS